MSSNPVNSCPILHPSRFRILPLEPVSPRVLLQPPNPHRIHYHLPAHRHLRQPLHHLNACRRRPIFRLRSAGVTAPGVSARPARPERERKEGAGIGELSQIASLNRGHRRREDADPHAPRRRPSPPHYSRLQVPRLCQVRQAGRPRSQAAFLRRLPVGRA